MERTLILYVPVIHKGYIDFLNDNAKRVSDVFIIDDNLLQELTNLKSNIAALDSQSAEAFLTALIRKKISTLSKENLPTLKGRKILLVQDEVSRKLHKKYLQNEDVEWASVFLRWDQDSISTENPTSDIPVSDNVFDKEMIQKAYTQAQQSSDWWRQVGGVLTKKGEILATGYNQGIPDDHEPYRVGAVRDFLQPGEKPELVNYIHAEQKIIAESARKGISLEGTSLYLTHFPCPVCAKLIAYSGIKNLYFSEGWSVLDGQNTLNSANVKLSRVPRK